MILTIFITLVSLIGLIVLHELGHFILAKKFGVKVEEFGIGYPPRIFGKKIGETIFSINLLPFGAFVRIYGEEKREKDTRSFSQKPIWQRALIVLAGCISFWLISAVLLSTVMNLGIPRAIGDEVNENLIAPLVQIVAVSSGSPAEAVGIKPGDIIKQLTINNQQLTVNKVKEIIEFTEANKGKEVSLTIGRGKEVFEVNLVPRISPPEGEGPMGVALVRTVIKSYPWYEAPLEGILATGNLTVLIIQGWIQALKNLFQGLPTGVQLMGPVGIFSLTSQMGQLGVNYFLQFIAMLAIYMGLFNLLPIPAVDGGRLLFLGIEGILRKPIPQKIEQRINTFFFVLLVALMIFVTFKDIQRLLF
ncbi:site-2 protease family protein [Patescibacteria group bacterium]|nr:site-2 protease family protein [Patescibacteria group bacterium]